MILALILYGVLFAIAAFGPLRWSLIAYLLLSTIDFRQSGESIGMLNAAKGIILPVYLLWRLRHYSGHQKMVLAPIAWSLLVVYAAVAGFWSFSPISAVKLVGHMAGSLLICFVFMRATKGRLLRPQLVLPLALGTLAIGLMCSVFQPNWGGNESRFSAFTTAQAYASFLAALYSLALCASTLRMYTRLALAAMLVTALVFNGSRIWTIGIVVATVVALLVSDFRPWVKIWGVGLMLVLTAVLIGAADRVIGVLAQYAESNRIAAAITAAYEGDTRSAGLGTYRFRRGVDAKEIEGIAGSSVLQLLFGHGTSNGALLVTGSQFRMGMDANRLMHNEWLRVMYEWGMAGGILWLMFIGSIAVYAVQGLRKEHGDYAKPLVVYLPAFLMGLTGENIIAGAGSSVSVGFLLLIAFAGVAHRHPKRPSFRQAPPAQTFDPVLSSHAGGSRRPHDPLVAPQIPGMTP